MVSNSRNDVLLSGKFPSGEVAKKPKSHETMVHLQVQKFLKVEQGSGTRVAAVGKCVCDPGQRVSHQRLMPLIAGFPQSSGHVKPQLPVPAAAGDQEPRNNGFELSSREEN